MNRFFHEPGSTQNPPRMIVKHKGYWYMTSRISKWQLEDRPHGFSAGDCCWWTGLSVLAYDDNLLLQGLTQMTPVKGETWCRHPFGRDLQNTKDPINEFTRDHMISALTALSVKDLATAKQAIAKTKMRLSKRKLLGPGDWFWLKAIQNEDSWKGKAYAKLFGLFTMPAVAGSVIWDKIVKNMLGKKAIQVNPNEQLDPPLKYTTKASRFVSEKLRLFAFQGHLWGMQIYAMRKLGLTGLPVLSAAVRAYSGKFNYLVSLYTGKKICKYKIKNYVPRTGWVWQSWIDNGSKGGHVAGPKEKLYNAIDKDLLWKLYNEL